jgi:hypothetical protein
MSADRPEGPANDPSRDLTAGEPGDDPEPSFEQRSYLLVRDGDAPGTSRWTRGRRSSSAARQANIAIEHERVSRRHAVFFRKGNELFVRDLDSRHGQVGGRTVRAAQIALSGGDLVRLGGVEIPVATRPMSSAASRLVRWLSVQTISWSRSEVGRVVAVARRFARAEHRAHPGKTGVGKGVLARMILAGAPRANGLYVRINCAAIPDAPSEASSRNGVAPSRADRRLGAPHQAASGQPPRSMRSASSAAVPGEAPRRAREPLRRSRGSTAEVPVMRARSRHHLPEGEVAARSGGPLLSISTFTLVSSPSRIASRDGPLAT